MARCLGVFSLLLVPPQHALFPMSSGLIVQAAASRHTWILCRASTWTPASPAGARSSSPFAACKSVVAATWSRDYATHYDFLGAERISIVEAIVRFFYSKLCLAPAITIDDCTLVPFSF